MENLGELYAFTWKLARKINFRLYFPGIINYLRLVDNETEITYFMPDITKEEFAAILTSENPRQIIREWEIVPKQRYPMQEWTEQQLAKDKLKASS